MRPPIYLVPPNIGRVVKDICERFVIREKADDTDIPREAAFEDELPDVIWLHPGQDDVFQAITPKRKPKVDAQRIANVRPGDVADGL